MFHPCDLTYKQKKYIIKSRNLYQRRLFGGFLPNDHDERILRDEKRDFLERSDVDNHRYDERCEKDDIFIEIFVKFIVSK